MAEVVQLDLTCAVSSKLLISPSFNVLYVSSAHYSCPTPLKNLDINRLVHPAQPSQIYVYYLFSQSHPMYQTRISRSRTLFFRPEAREPGSFLVSRTLGEVTIRKSARFSWSILGPDSHSQNRGNTRIDSQKVSTLESKPQNHHNVCRIFGPDSISFPQAAYLTRGS